MLVVSGVALEREFEEKYNSATIMLSTPRIKISHKSYSSIFQALLKIEEEVNDGEEKDESDEIIRSIKPDI